MFSINNFKLVTQLLFILIECLKRLWDKIRKAT